MITVTERLSPRADRGRQRAQRHGEGLVVRVGVVGGRDRRPCQVVARPPADLDARKRAVVARLGRARGPASGES